MPLLFALTIFVAAALLFLLEPMVGKMLLPYFGGAPAVWNTCLAFFQAALLAGYGYAHGLTRQRTPRRQLLIHLAVLALPFLVLPLTVRSEWAPRDGANPMLSLIGILGAAIAVPFVVVAATSPLLQQWLAATRHRHASDPYYLYAASNTGSLFGLIAYPMLVEPHLTLDEQSRLWTAGYALLAALVAGCVVAIRQAGVPTPHEGPDLSLVDADYAPAAPTASMRLQWIALAFVPSSVLLGVTAYLSTDVSPVPLMWVVPLALYLLSFMLAFSRLPVCIWRVFALALPLLVLAQIYHAFTGHEGENYSLARLASIHLATFFCAAMSCHGELARLRPRPAFLTEYYFWLSLGGVLGGLFNALVAPLVFSSLVEYPLALSLACAFSPLALWRWPRGRKWPDLVLAAMIAPAAVLILLKWPHAEPVWTIAICIALCALTLGRPIAFGLSVATLFAAVSYHDDEVDHVVLRHRDF